ncbi:MAG: hypothetical protein OHK0053_08490 [Microscillaceae bacterium]
MIKKLYCLSFLALLFYLGGGMPQLQAQGERFGIRFENRGQVALDNPDPAFPSEGRVNAWGLALNGSFRKKIDKQKLGLTTLTLGAEYRFARLNYEGFELAPGQSLVQNLHAARLQIDWVKVLNPKKPKWILALLFRPGIFSDFEALDWHHVRLEGAALLSYRTNQKAIYGFGVGRSAGFGRTLILPLLQYTYRSPKFVADILLPSRADVGWIKKKWYWGLNASIVGNQFQLGNLQNGFPGSDRAGISDLTLGPVLRYNLSKNNYFLLEGGVTGLRRWEFRDDRRDGDQRFIQDFDPQPTWFLRTGFQIRY